MTAATLPAISGARPDKPNAKAPVGTPPPYLRGHEKPPFAQWVNDLPDMNGRVIPFDHLRQDCLVVLIPSYDRLEDGAAHVKDIYREIFGEELWSICTKEEWFPPKQDWKTFQQWFDIEVHSVVMDAVDEEIEKEED